MSFPDKLQPLRSVSELQEWSPNARPHDQRFKCHVDLAERQTVCKLRLLVCHDLQGGYGDDSLLDGGQDPEQFGLYSWHLVDTFVYFSHNLVTIPPPAWTSAAHLHGTQVLGTFITEWEEGKKVCEELFCSKASAESVAHQLVSIATFFNFEGWLINIENNLSLDCLDNVLHFLRQLHFLMHKASDHAVVLWYDAVTTEGRLQWQNGLTDLNRPFMEACDGLFVNYAWQAKTPKLAAAAAGSRSAEVYMGVDVFGRGSFGGGQMNSSLAVDAAFSAGLSCAIFAPGWVWEESEPKSEWRSRSSCLWDDIDAASRRHRPYRALIASLPFQTSFCRGGGQAIYKQGRVVSSEPWYNLSKQHIQPLHQELDIARVVFEVVHGSDDSPGIKLSLTVLSASICSGRAVDGSQVLQISGHMQPHEVLALPLFSASLPPGRVSVSMAVRGVLPGCCLKPAFQKDLYSTTSNTASCRAQFYQKAGENTERSTGGESPKASHFQSTHGAFPEQDWSVHEEGVAFPDMPPGVTAILYLECLTERSDRRIQAEIGKVRLSQLKDADVE